MNLRLVFITIIMIEVYFELSACSFTEINGCRLSNDGTNITFVCNNPEGYEKDIIDKIANEKIAPMYYCNSLFGESIVILEDRTAVKEMHFLDCELKVIPNIIFQHFTNYQILVTSGLGLEKVRPLYANDLKILDLSWNKITELTEKLFEKTTGLKVLNISNNCLTGIPHDFLIKVTNLDIIDLSFNKIGEIGANAFPSMKSLNLSNNGINELKNESFAGFDKLVSLQFAHNQIASIPIEMIKMAVNLIEVNLSFNNLDKIELLEFPDESKLRLLDLSHNKFVHFDTPFLRNLEELVHLDISWNRIENVSAEVFQSLQNLVYLGMSNNPIKEVNDNLFSQLINLRHLNLSSMYLSKLLPGTFSNQTALEDVDLSFNKITSLNSSIFPPLPNQLKLISIRNNTLEQLVGFKSYPNTTKIQIDGYYCEDWNYLLPQLKWYNSSKPLPCVPKPSAKKTIVNPDTWILIVGITVPVVIIIIAAGLLWRFYCQKKIEESLDHSGLSYVRSLATEFDYKPLEEFN